MLIYRNGVFLPGHALSSMQVTLSKNHSPHWQSLALGQLENFQIAVN